MLAAVYVIIGLFALASAMALYACLKVVMLRIPGLGHCRWVRVTHGTVMSGWTVAQVTSSGVDDFGEKLWIGHAKYGLW